MSSAASKSYRARTFLGSLTGVEFAEVAAASDRFVEGYRVLLALAARGEDVLSFSDSSMALRIWFSSSWDSTTLGSLLTCEDFFAGCKENYMTN